ncbi:F-box protein At5g07610 [Malania oleifera]|uniref:F-box protein At5g07610 n=1 Tax=Malania oleifera TaxID=397392 RepID=UPI0025AEBA4C|nr:F-box protein At5g07610 [Malania oleifera]
MPRRSTTFSTAVAVFGNDDLLTEILIWLPVRSLMKFKSVSRRWLSIITNPYFAHLRNRAHKATDTTASALFLHRSSLLMNPEFEFVSIVAEDPFPAPFRFLTFVHDPRGVKILQSCNGLLCCCSFRASRPKRNFYVCNPTTKQYTTLPRINRPKFSTIFGVNLAFDPSKSPHYKVVCVRSSESSPDHYQIEMYSSQTGPWRLSGEPFTNSNNINFDRGVFWNGAINWVSSWGDSLYFNVDSECLGTMPMPAVPDGWFERRFWYFGESTNRLHLIEMNDPRSREFNVLEMGRDYSGWFVKYRVDLGSIANAFPEMVWDDMSCAFSVLSVMRRESDEDSFLVVHIPGKAIRYNFKDGTFRKLCDLGCNDGEHSTGTNHFLEFEWRDAYQYIETLSCV